MRTERKELNIQIGKRLQTARENSGYTQEAFAEALYVGVEHYRKIELGYVWITTREYVDFI